LPRHVAAVPKALAREVSAAALRSASTRASVPTSTRGCPRSATREPSAALLALRVPCVVNFLIRAARVTVMRLRVTTTPSEDTARVVGSRLLIQPRAAPARIAAPTPRAGPTRVRATAPTTPAQAEQRKCRSAPSRRPLRRDAGLTGLRLPLVNSSRRSGRFTRTDSRIPRLAQQQDEPRSFLTSPSLTEGTRE
jgi:hypothetical protein